MFQIIDVGEQPDCEQCILVSRKASLNDMLVPIALVTFSSYLLPKQLDEQVGTMPLLAFGSETANCSKPPVDIATQMC